MDVTFSFRSVHELQNFLKFKGVLITRQRKLAYVRLLMKSILKYTQMAFWRIEKRLMERLQIQPRLTVRLPQSKCTTMDDGHIQLPDYLC